MLQPSLAEALFAFSCLLTTNDGIGSFIQSSMAEDGYFTAIASISMFAFFGRAATAKAERAG